MNPHHFLGNARLLQLELRLPLQHRLEARCLGFHRSQTLDIGDHLGVARRIVSGRDTGDVPLHLHQSLLLRSDLADDRAELLHCQLHFGQPPLQRADLLHGGAPLLVELAHVVRHLLQLLDTRLVVIPIDVDGLQHLVQMLDHGVQTSAQGARACRTFAAFAHSDHPVALLL